VRCILCLNTVLQNKWSTNKMGVVLIGKTTKQIALIDTL